MPHPPAGARAPLRFELLLDREVVARIDARRTIAAPGRRQPASRGEIVRALIERALDLDETKPSSSPDATY